MHLVLPLGPAMRGGDSAVGRESVVKIGLHVVMFSLCGFWILRMTDVCYQKAFFYI